MEESPVPGVLGMQSGQNAELFHSTTSKLHMYRILGLLSGWKWGAPSIAARRSEQEYIACVVGLAGGGIQNYVRLVFWAYTVLKLWNSFISPCEDCVSLAFWAFRVVKV